MEGKPKQGMGGKSDDQPDRGQRRGQKAPGRQSEYDSESRPGHEGQYERNRPDQQQGRRERSSREGMDRDE